QPGTHHPDAGGAGLKVLLHFRGHVGIDIAPRDHLHGKRGWPREELAPVPIARLAPFRNERDVRREHAVRAAADDEAALRNHLSQPPADRKWIERKAEANLDSPVVISDWCHD